MFFAESQLRLFFAIGFGPFCDTDLTVRYRQIKIKLKEQNGIAPFKIFFSLLWVQKFFAAVHAIHFKQIVDSFLVCSVVKHLAVSPDIVRNILMWAGHIYL